MSNNTLLLSPDQDSLVHQALDARIFLEGPAGTGKTIAGVERLLAMLDAGIPGDSILLMAPQRTLAEPYYDALRQPETFAGGVVNLVTVGGLAQRMVSLFWPLVAGQAGFARPDLLPTYLTLETAQYYMAHLVEPLLEEGLFESVTIERNRLYSQVLDNLNKAAVVGFPMDQIGERLQAAWVGETGQSRVYQDVQTCADLFRRYCLEHNILDYSLQMEVFWRHLWPAEECRGYLVSIYRHLVFDNLEEDTPVAHDLLRDWIPHLESVLLIVDHEAGYRRFLGADPQTAYGLKPLCDQQLIFNESFVMPPQVQALERRFSGILGRSDRVENNSLVSPLLEGEKAGEAGSNLLHVLNFEYHRFYPQMLDWAADRIAELIFEEQIPPGEIVILAPYLSDALRFSLVDRLQHRQIPVASHRPSRALREEPVTQCLLTLSALAHPAWSLSSSKFDVVYSLLQAIDGLDLVRAQLLVEAVFHPQKGDQSLAAFESIRPEIQERVTYLFGERYERLRLWLASAQQEQSEFDHFLSRLFGELLSQPGFRFHADYSAGEITANLIESVSKFRWAAGRTLADEGFPLGKEYLLMVEKGVIASQYIRSWETPQGEAVLLAPAFTFLMSNRPVLAQFWLDAGSRGWAERLDQPLTQPYVLSRGWEAGRLWTDLDEVQAGEDLMYRLAVGLMRRCRAKIYLGLSELGEQGYEQRGPLLQAFQRLLRQSGIS